MLACGIAVMTLLIACSKAAEQNPGNRIVVLSPEVAEIVAALGAEGQIVGLTRECDYPPSLADIPKVGNFGAVDKEAILGLKPDLIFSSALEQEALAAELAKLGLKVEQVYPKSVAEIAAAVMRVGELIGREAAARALADSLSAGVDEILAQTAGKARPKVYLEIYRDPLMSVADASYVGDLIETAGGDNVFDSLERDYCRIDAEDVIAAKPDIMICYSRDNLKSILDRKGWQDIPAIKNGRVYFEQDINPDWLQRATPRALMGMRRLQELLAGQVSP